MRNAIFLTNLNNLKDLNCGHVRKFVTLFIIFWEIYLLDLVQNRQIVGIPMGTNCVPLDVDLFCYERDFVLSLTIIKQMLKHLK